MTSKWNIEFFKGRPESSPYVTNSKDVDLSSKKDPLKIYRIASNETALISEVLALTYRENVTISLGQGETPT